MDAENDDTQISLNMILGKIIVCYFIFVRYKIAFILYLIFDIRIMIFSIAEATQIERRRLSGSGTKQTPVPGDQIGVKSVYLGASASWSICISWSIHAPRYSFVSTLDCLCILELLSS